MSATDILANQAASEIDFAYCRAALYSALAVGFQAPRDDGLSRLLSSESRSSLSRAAALLYPSGEPDLASAIEALARGNPEEIPALHRAWFGHTARGPVPPYETEYGNEALFQQPQELGDIMGFYHAFGLTMKHGKRERPDHVSCELEFLMFLALKEAYALEQDDREMLGEVRKAEKSFLKDHVARFVPTFATKLMTEDPSGFYGALAELCLRFIAAECHRLHVSPGAANLNLRPADDGRVPMACGSGADCAAMPGACPPEDADSV
jgi:DMSO reductase family type II enzyme chaperone